jgi:DNA repair protein RadC
MGYTRDILGHYQITSGPQDEHAILAAAEDILLRRLERQGSISDPGAASSYLRMRLGGLAHEEFHVTWLDSRHRIIGTEMLSRGSIDGAEVHPREVVRSALRHNAAACILSHNHPSGVTEPSAADRAITRRLVEALALIEVRVLDHIIVGAADTMSFASRGLL